jgi:hypothetical protein
MGHGPEDKTTPEQCSVAPSVFQISWNFKLIFGFFLDVFPFITSRRKGWILFGWTGALVMLAYNAVMVETYRAEGRFDSYMYSMMVLCIFTTFSDVGGDGMIIEMSKYEPDDKKGYILTTCQMLRFFLMMISTGLGTLFMSGESYQPPHRPGESTAGDIKLPFELSYGAMHWLLLCASIPCYIGMWVWLKDPPAPEGHVSGCRGIQHAFKHVWQAMQSYAVFNLLVQSVGIYAIAGLINPANPGIQSICHPSNVQSGIGAFLGNLLFVWGVWIFRKFLLHRNWRFTLFGTQAFVALTSALAIMSVYDTWGISRNGWFFMLQNSVPMLIQGMGQVVGSLAVVEISPPGLEATIYELLISATNGSIALSAALQVKFMQVFGIQNINYKTFYDNETENANKLARATIFCLMVNLAGAAVFMWFLPRNPGQCREWRDNKAWHRPTAAILNLVVFLVPFAYANYTVVTSIAAP